MTPREHVYRTEEALRWCSDNHATVTFSEDGLVRVEYRQGDNTYAYTGDFRQFVPIAMHLKRHQIARSGLE